MTAPPESEAAEGPLISPISALMIVLVGVFAFAALVVLVAYAPDLRGTDNGEAHALSKSAVGYAGIVEALRLAGEPVMVSRTDLPGRRRAGLFVVTPPLEMEDIAMLARRVRWDGPVLVILPKWLAAPDPLHRGWVRKVAVVPLKSTYRGKGVIAHRQGISRPTLHGVTVPFGARDLFAEGPVESLQSFTATGLLPVLVDDTGGIILSFDPRHQLYILSDPDLINTRGLRNLDTLGSALAILRHLRSGDGPVIFDVVPNGLGKARSLLRLLFDPPFLAVTLCLTAAAALAGFQAVCRFGPVRRAPRAFALGKEALVDNSAALIRLAGRETRMAGRYAVLTRDLAARAVGAPRELAGQGLTDFLDRLAVGRGATDRLSHLTTLAEHPGDRARLVAVARRLFDWRLEMTRERK